MKALAFISLLLLPSLGFAASAASVGLPPTVPGASGTTGLAIQFTNAGLSSIQWNGTEMLSNGTPSVSWVGLVQADGSWTGGALSPKTTVNVASQTLTQTYTWGTIQYVYTTSGNELLADVTIKNTSTTPVGMFIMQLAAIQFPTTPLEYDGSDPMVGWNMGNPTIIPTSFGSGSLVVTNEDVANPLMVGWPWPLDSAKTIFPLNVLTGQDAMYPSSYPDIIRQIPAGSSMEFKIGFRFGAPSATTYELAGDIYTKFATTFPQTLNWPDRRPIAQLMLTSYNGTYATNPRRWFGDPTVDTTTPAGIAAFQARVLAFADNAIAICKAENAQAAITWDIEGEQFPQAISYIGDPRLIPTLDPEMSGVVDAYFKKFADAGLKFGMTIRPQQLVLSNSNQSAYQEEIADPGTLMVAKIGYAYKRWGAKVFYVDSNGAGDNPYDVKFFQAVMTAYPDVLLIPEQSNMQYYSITAPYGQFDLGVTGTPPDVRWTYPRAFRVFTFGDQDISGAMTTLVNSIMMGDSFLFRGWFNATENPKIMQIYQQAGVTGTN